MTDTEIQEKRQNYDEMLDKTLKAIRKDMPIKAYLDTCMIISACFQKALVYDVFKETLSEDIDRAETMIEMSNSVSDYDALVLTETVLEILQNIKKSLDYIEEKTTDD